jgi:putative ATP-dependent endonuclease of the OLD family
MNLHKAQIKNFRLLREVELVFEKRSTVIVGRNNSGKTSVAELFSRFLGDTAPRFALEDFSVGAHDDFWSAFKQFTAAPDDLKKARAAMPFIEVVLTFAYEKNEDFGPLAEFVIDLNDGTTEAVACARFELAEGTIKGFFADIALPAGPDEGAQKAAFFKAIRDRVPRMFKVSLHAIDPNDPENCKQLEWPRLRGVIQCGFINAQRGLDDTTDAANDVLGKILGTLFRTAKADTAAQSDKETARKLENAVESVQKEIDESFSEQLKALLPAMELFGYPGLSDPKLRTETTLGVDRLLDNHTKIRYPGANGINLPEGYNGLGARNLIFILFKLLEFFKEYQAASSAPGVHLVFVEEPEAHLHPQMQEVFIKKLSDIAAQFAKCYNNEKPWPVQFVVSTHSSHVANKASFRSMRYFLAVPDSPTGHCRTRVKDLCRGFTGDLKDDESFLHEYMTLTRCDLLFADRAILIEGPTERILLPKMIDKVDLLNTGTVPPLASQYLSVIEVGGAYAHRFFKLLDFLELRTLIITDLDSVKANAANKYEACRVSEGTFSSNTCINAWFKSAAGGRPPLSEIVAKTDKDKTRPRLRLAFQIPEREGKLVSKNGEDALRVAIGRSFEDAFYLANATAFKLPVTSANEVELEAWNATRDIEKTNFALEYAIEKAEWAVPRYIKDGLTWLAGKDEVCGPYSPPRPTPTS